MNRAKELHEQMLDAYDAGDYAKGNYLDALYANYVPETPQEAAFKVSDALLSLSQDESALARAGERKLNLIAKRLASGHHRLTDLVSLRSATILLKSRGDVDDVEELLTTVLRGMSCPKLLVDNTFKKAIA